jgi:hypothetical protein
LNNKLGQGFAQFVRGRRVGHIYSPGISLNKTHPKMPVQRPLLQDECRYPLVFVYTVIRVKRKNTDNNVQ